MHAGTMVYGTKYMPQHSISVGTGWRLQQRVSRSIECQCSGESVHEAQVRKLVLSWPDTLENSR